MGYITTADGIDIFYKDWGPAGAPAIMFHHGWPLSADDWDSQMLFFLERGYRVIAHDRRGHGRSSQNGDGNDMDSYVADVMALTDVLDLKGAVHVGHSTGGGEVVRYVARARKDRVAKAVLIGAVTPVMAQSLSNPDGLPVAIFDGLRAAMADRASLFRDLPSGPFYGFNREGVQARAAIIDNWWRQGMMGGIKAQYDCIRAFSETDFTQDLQAIDVPVLLLHGTDDQLVPVDTCARRAMTFLRHGTLKVYDGLSHGMATTHPDWINADILAFIEEGG